MLQSSISCCVCFILFGESGRGKWGAMVAWHERRGMGRSELGASGRGARCAANEARWGQGGHAGRGERPRIEADRTGCACEASHLDTQALRRGGVRVRDGGKSADRGRLRASQIHIGWITCPKFEGEKTV